LLHDVLSNLLCDPTDWVFVTLGPLRCA